MVEWSGDSTLASRSPLSAVLDTLLSVELLVHLGDSPSGRRLSVRKHDSELLNCFSDCPPFLWSKSNEQSLFIRKFSVGHPGLKA